MEVFSLNLNGFWTSITGYMNDIATISSVKTERGTSYPFARSFSFSLQVTF